MKLTVSKSKNTASFYVQKSIRKENGTSTTITIEKLGTLDEVKAKANGKDPYQWAQEYVNELNRMEYEQKKEIIIPYSPSKLMKKGVQKSFNCGYLFLQDIYYSLGLDKICQKIADKYKFEYDLNDILSKLIYTRILYPSSKLSSYKQSATFIEQPTFKLHDVYRSLSLLSKESDFIQSELYKNSQNVLSRRKDILYYDCTNFYFEIEEADELRKYGKAKQNKPLPIVGMGLFMDYDGIPLAFDIYPGNNNEQLTLKPIQERVLNDYGLEDIVVCTDAGLSSKENRKFNDKSLFGHRTRSFITTQSIKQLPEHLKDYALDKDGWHLPGDSKVYNLDDISEQANYNKVFYKDRWIVEDISEKKKQEGAKPLEQHLVVSFSPKYKIYQQAIRQGQINRAMKLIETGNYKRRAKNQNDPHRFIEHKAVTTDGEVCSNDHVFLNEEAIRNEQQYDGFYAVCTNLENISVEQIIRINRKRWEIEECFRIMKTEFKARPVYVQTQDHIKSHFLTCFLSLFIFRILEKRLGEAFTCEEISDTLRDMIMTRPGEKLGYIASYTRTDLTDRLHETAGFRTDYEIINDINMKKIIRKTKKRSNK